MEADTRKVLLDELARAEAELAALEHQRDEVRARVQATRAALVAQSAPAERTFPACVNGIDPVPSTPAEKVRLFRSLFRGRTERRDHLEHLAGCLRGSVPHLIVLQGGMSAKERKAAADSPK